MDTKTKRPMMRFLKSLMTAFKTPNPETVELYREKLSHWHCSEQVWNRALSRLVADFEFLPSLAKIYEYLRLAESQYRKSSLHGYVLFELDGRRYTIPFTPGQDIPALPLGGSNSHVSVLGSTFVEPCSHSEARSSFLHGWISSGADPAKAQSVFDAIDRNHSIAIALLPKADYDDS